jgi:lipopolysaccharide biosynthesis glycosyltransferase
MESRIYITYHKQSHLVSGGILKPIQVGPGPDLPGCPLRDNCGVNIADRNDRYCEMTAAYWAWKNAVDFEFIGLLHYRRFLDFNETRLHLDNWGVVNWPAFTTDFETRFGLNDKAITAAVSGYDILLPKKWSVHNAGYRNLHEHYVRAPHHHESDLVLCRDVIARRCPEFLPSWRRVFNSDRGWFNNMFVFRRDIFTSYCSWLFPLLEEVENQIPFSRYSVQERRVMGYLAERLLNVWLLHYLASNPETKVRELDRVFIKDPSQKVWDPGISRDQDSVVSVVIASDDNYVPHLGALIASIFANISKQSSVDLLILDGGISEEHQDMLKHLVPAESSLYFIPMQDEFTSYFTHMHFSRATFYRLILDSILISRDKIIYIDCDTIVLGDLCELWEIDMEDMPIAAVHDYVMEHFCRSKVLSSDFTGSLPARTYLRDYVGIPTEYCDQYFQAGLLIMNLRRIREMGLSKRMSDSLLAKKHWFLDQDILNKYFCGSHISLPAEWNYVNCTDDIRASLGQRRVKELEDARRNLKMIHYAGYEAKPWVNRSASLSEFYFYYLRRTFWYEKVLNLREPGGLQSSAHGESGWSRVKLRRLLRKLWRRLPWFIRRIANPAAYAMQRRLTGG